MIPEEQQAQAKAMEQKTLIEQAREYKMSIWSLRGTLSNIQYNIKHYEELAEEELDPDDRRVTLRDLRADEAELLEAIAILSERSKAEGQQGKVLDDTTQELLCAAMTKNITPPDAKSKAVVAIYRAIGELVEMGYIHRPAQSTQEKVEEIMGVVKDWWRRKDPWTWAELERRLTEHFNKGKA